MCLSTPPPPPPSPFAEAMVRDSFTAPAAPSVSQLNQMEATTLEWLQQEAERVSNKPAVQPPPPTAVPDGEWTPHGVLYVRWGEGRCRAGLPTPSTRQNHMQLALKCTQLHHTSLCIL